MHVHATHVRFSSVYECTHHFTRNIFILSLFTYFYKMLYNSFPQFVHNLYYLLKHFVNTRILYSYINQKSKVNTLSASTKTMRLVIKKHVDNLMFCREESGRTLDYRTTLRVAIP